MEPEDAILALSALAQSTRLEGFQHLVSHVPDGLAAGDLARLLGVPQNTLSAHLTILSHARLVTSERRSRSIIYRADLDRVRQLVLFLLKDCCGGRPDVCRPLLTDLVPCPPKKARTHA